MAAADVLVQDASADAVASLEYEHRAARSDRLPGRRQTGEPGADDDEVDVACGGCLHRPDVIARAALAKVEMNESHSRTAEREEERRLNMRTLVIASAASAAAALLTSQLWIAGTWIAAAMTPVIVTLVSEMLNRPTERIAKSFTTDRGPLAAARAPDGPRRPEPDRSRTERRWSRRPERARRGHRATLDPRRPSACTGPAKRRRAATAVPRAWRPAAVGAEGLLASAPALPIEGPVRGGRCSALRACRLRVVVRPRGGARSPSVRCSRRPRSPS